MIAVRAVCPKCGRSVATMRADDGDGLSLALRTHRYRRGDPTVCPGSGDTVHDDEKDA